MRPEVWDATVGVVAVNVCSPATASAAGADGSGSAGEHPTTPIHSQQKIQIDRAQRIATSAARYRARTTHRGQSHDAPPGDAIL
jgi:hypothetical protein